MTGLEGGLARRLSTWSTMDWTKFIPASRVKCTQSGSKSPQKSSSIIKLGGQLNINWCKTLNTSGRSLGYQVGLVLRLGGLRKKRTWGKLWQRLNTPLVSVRILVKLWSILPSAESSSRSSQIQFVRKEMITRVTLSKRFKNEYPREKIRNK